MSLPQLPELDMACGTSDENAITRETWVAYWSPGSEQYIDGTDECYDYFWDRMGRKQDPQSNHHDRCFVCVVRVYRIMMSTRDERDRTIRESLVGHHRRAIRREKKASNP